MILYNGATGGLGRQLEPALRLGGLEGHALRARLEDRQALRRELAVLAAGQDPVLLQLAARVSVPACEADPEGTLRTNVSDTRDTVLDFVEWARSRALRPQVLYVSSGHVYAPRPGERIREGDAVAPRSAYARSKLQAEEALRAAATERGFGLLVARVFGLVAPRQPPGYVLPGLIRRVREHRLLGIPGLGYVRDYLDARDVCQDLLALCRPGIRDAWRGQVVNVCSGEGVTLRELLRQVVRVLRPGDEAALMAEATEAPGRADDVPWIVGDPSAFVELASEAPRRIPLAETVREACADT